MLDYYDMTDSELLAELNRQGIALMEPATTDELINFLLLDVSFVKDEPSCK